MRPIHSPRPASNCVASALPPEVWLEIIPHIPYSPSSLFCLCLTCHDIQHLVQAHELSLVAAIKSAQPGLTSSRLFPGLSVTTYADLRTLHSRLKTLDAVGRDWMQIATRSTELHWLEGRWRGVHYAGLLLLYRIIDASTYSAKLQLLRSLPSSSLACLLFALVAGATILRVVGPTPIHSRHARNLAAEERRDVELAFEELLLLHGPEFFMALLGECGSETQRTRWAVALLNDEIAGMDARQAPLPNGQSQPPTLISTLRRTLSTKAECGITACTNKMWEILSSTAFDSMDDTTLAKLTSGEPIPGGMKRMGF